MAIGRWPAPMTSRMTPPTPVFAPPKGSIADGWLCVSAFTAIVVPARSMTMPALPTNALRTNGASIASVAFAELAEKWRNRLPPSRSILRAERLVRAVLAPRLRERLELDVGRVAAERVEVVDDRVELGRVERHAALDVEREPASWSSSRIGIVAAAVSVERSVNHGSTSPSVAFSMTWFERSFVASRSSRRSSSSPTTSKRRPEAAPLSSICSRRADSSSAVAVGSVTPGRGVVSTARADGTVHVPDWSSGSTRSSSRRCRSPGSSGAPTKYTSATSMLVTAVKPRACASASSVADAWVGAQCSDRETPRVNANATGLHRHDSQAREGCHRVVAAERRAKEKPGRNRTKRVSAHESVESGAHDTADLRAPRRVELHGGTGDRRPSDVQRTVAARGPAGRAAPRPLARRTRVPRPNASSPATSRGRSRRRRSSPRHCRGSRSPRTSGSASTTPVRTATAWR